MNIIMAVNMGGDDFVPKPFDLSVLTAKVQAVLRRTYDLSGKVPVLEHQGAILNLNDASLTYNGEKIDLTKNEFRILQTLMENKGRLVSRDTLMAWLWETDNYIEENTLTVNIARLRRKLDKAGLTDFISTKVGEGYIIRQERQVKSVARANQPNVAESISNHKKSTVQKTQVNGKSARKTVTKQSEKGRKK